MAIYPKEYIDRTKGIFRLGRPDTALSTCFVLMPFARQFDEVYSAIRTACERPELLLSCFRADDFYGAGHLMEDILKGIVHSEYIVADVTGKNPNVFYELGIAHCCKAASKVFIVTQTMDDVPFDLGSFRCLPPYSPNPAGLRKLEHDLVRALQSDAGDVFRFVVSNNETYNFTERLSGRGRDFYTFRITEIWVARTDLKLSILVQQQSLNRGPADFGPSHHSLQVGEATNIQQTDWVLRVDRIENSQAFFSVIRRL